MLGPRVSASAYEDLRACPYRYFARRLLRLNDVNDLDADLDKRDFGQWLHALLADFHADLLANAIEPSIDSLDDLRTRLDRAADQARQTLRLDEAEFLPFSASWPAVREGYLRWLCLPEQRATRFVEAEQWHEQVLGRWVLVGKIDRMDRLRDGPALVLDYKTEATEKTRARIKAGGEDSQLAFYAALLPEDAVQAAYVTVTDSREVAKATQSFRLPDVDAQREALVLGLLDDLTRVAADAPLTAMGEGRACAHCEAGGLCRKDFWGGA